MLSNQRILLAVSAGIAAYKTPQLVRDLRAAGAEVRVVLTKDAAKLVAPLALQAVSGHLVQTSLWEGDAGFAMDHIELAKWATAVLVAPTTANTIAKLAAGMADDLVMTLCLATEAPLFIAPAMNQAMWKHPATIQNTQTLAQRGAMILGPESGAQACGDVGPGRMREPNDLVADLSVHLSVSQIWKGKKILITAGPTQESWDPVRYFTNRSTGRMGFALAAAASRAGAEVVLVAGPVGLNTPAGVKRMDVTTAAEMANAVKEHASSFDVFIASAAVADFRPKKLKQKFKKDGQPVTLELEPTEDIVKTVSHLPNAPFIVGFAAETANLLENSRAKMQRKNMNMIIANTVNENQGFGSGPAEVWLLGQGQKLKLEAQSKEALAPKLIALIAAQLSEPVLAPQKHPH